MKASWLPEPPELSFAILTLTDFSEHRIWLSIIFCMWQKGKSNLLFVIEMNDSCERFKTLPKWR